MEIESKYSINKDKAEALIFKAILYGAKVDGLIWKKDEYYSSSEDPSKESQKFRIRKERLIKYRTQRDLSGEVSNYDASVLNNIVKSFLDNSVYDDAEYSPHLYEYNAYFTYKNKTKEKGFEVNTENETSIEPSGYDGFNALFKYANMRKYFEKNKKTFSFYVSDIHIELVNYLGHFWAELEYVYDEKENEWLGTSEPDNFKAMKQIEEVCTKLGIDTLNRDTRDWRQIEQDLTASER